jgi:hypothetical protein
MHVLILCRCFRQVWVMRGLISFICTLGEFGWGADDACADDCGPVEQWNHVSKAYF